MNNVSILLSKSVAEGTHAWWVNNGPSIAPVPCLAVWARAAVEISMAE